MPLLTPDAAAYAAKLIADGFTVYVQANPQLDVRGEPIPFAWFHYELDGNFGTVSVGGMFAGYEHAMPVTPSREYGSSILLGESVAVPDDSVEYARLIARPTNYGAYTRATHKNAKPWGIGDRYVPALLAVLAATEAPS